MRSPAFGSYNAKPKQSCSYCDKHGFLGRYHLESECRQKYFDNLKASKSNVNSKKTINSFETDDLVNEINQKN